MTRVHSLTISRMRFTADAIVRLLEVVARLPVGAVHLPITTSATTTFKPRPNYLDTLSLDGFDLSHHEIGVAGAKALASAPGLNRIRELNMSHNSVRMSGLEALASTEYRAALRHLVVRGAVLDASQRQTVRDLLGRKVKVDS